jgi:hypothetical protein
VSHTVPPRLWSLSQCAPLSRLSLGQGKVSVVPCVYEDPDSVRSLALSIPLWSRGRGQYPGHFLFTPIPTQFYCPLLSSVVDKPVAPHREYRFAPFARIQDVSGTFQRDESIPHSDGFCDYVGIISLSTTEDTARTATSGTSFWRHAPTGLTGMPRNVGAKEYERVFSKKQEQCWEQIGFVPHKYNQMVVFPARAFHRIEFQNAGSASLRLTQNLYVVASD